MHKLTRGLTLLNKAEIDSFVREHRNKYTENYIRARGKEDGEGNIPAPQEAEPSPFEKELEYAVATLSSKIVTRHKQALELLDAKIKAEEEFLEKRLKNTVEGIENSYQVERDAAENAHALKDAHKQHEVWESRFNTSYEKLGRSPIRYIPHWLYIVLALAIFAGEIPLNALVFQIFGENQVMTWIMAVIIGLAVPLSAHFVGIKFREKEDGRWLPNFFKGMVALTVIVAALYGLSIMRQTYLGEFKDSLGLTDTLVESSFMFFWLNIAVLGAAVMISYLAHDSVPGYERLEKLYAYSRKVAKQEEQRRIKVLKTAGQRRAEELNFANAEYRDGVNAVNMLKGNYDMILKEGQEQELQGVERVNYEVAIYRTENMRVRPDKQHPRSFSKKHEFALKLQNMKEKLVN